MGPPLPEAGPIAVPAGYPPSRTSAAILSTAKS